MNTIDRHSQAGFSIFLVIISLVVLATVGATGWYVMSHRPQPTTQSATTTTSSTAVPADVKDNLKTVTIDNELSMQYPSDWKVEQDAIATYRSQDPTLSYDGETTQRTIISNPNDAVSILFRGGIGGIGGACTDHARGFIAASNHWDVKDSQYKLLAYVTTTGAASISIVQQADVAKAAVGKDACDLSFSSVMPDYHRGIGKVTISTPDKDKPLAVSAYQQYIETPAFKQAIAIVQSLGPM